MRIANNNQGILQLFSNMYGIRANKGKLFGSSASARCASAGGRNTLEDLLTGHSKNSYGVEGMEITESSNRRRIMPVSDKMKQHVFNRVKDAFYKYNGMSGNNEAELRKYHSAINDYLKTIKKEDRSATSWTIGQLGIHIADKVSSAVKAKVPGWTHGKPIPSDVLDEIFSDEDITSIVSGKSGTTRGLDVKI